LLDYTQLLGSLLKETFWVSVTPGAKIDEPQQGDVIDVNTIQSLQECYHNAGKKASQRPKRPDDGGVCNVDCFGGLGRIHAHSEHQERYHYGVL
jgi:hypothetical protein